MTPSGLEKWYKMRQLIVFIKPVEYTLLVQGFHKYLFAGDFIQWK